MDFFRPDSLHLLQEHLNKKEPNKPKAEKLTSKRGNLLLEKLWKQVFSDVP